MIKYNDEYNNRSDEDRNAERTKEYDDVNIIKYVHEYIKKGKASWSQYPWEERRAELIGWQHPFYRLYANQISSTFGFKDYLRRG
jgi:hypothetical protein